MNIETNEVTRYDMGTAVCERCGGTLIEGDTPEEILAAALRMGGDFFLGMSAMHVKHGRMNGFTLAELLEDPEVLPDVERAIEEDTLRRVRLKSGVPVRSHRMKKKYTYATDSASGEIDAYSLSDAYEILRVSTPAATVIWVEGPDGERITRGRDEDARENGRGAGYTPGLSGLWGSNAPRLRRAQPR